MTEFKKGDCVRVKRTWEPGERGTTWGQDPLIRGSVGKIGKITKVEPEGDYMCCTVLGDTIGHGSGWNFPDFVLEHVKKPQAARILTEKVTIDGAPCRKILGFEGILQKSDLPVKYVCNEPSFWLVDGKRGRHVFQDGKMRWVASWEDPAKCRVMLALPDEVKIDVGGYAFDGIQERSVWPETTFQELLVWLKRAGARLAKIRKQEKDAWSGKETIEI